MDLKSINEVLKFGLSSLSVTFIVIIVIIILHDYLTDGGAELAQASQLCSLYGYVASPKCW